VTTKHVLTLFALLAGAKPVAALNTDQLAKQLANPLAALTSVPLQLNLERDAGVADDGSTCSP
jgi:hypothetical protein